MVSYANELLTYVFAGTERREDGELKELYVCSVYLLHNDFFLKIRL